jgi:uncharacterized protein involved in high-affinity Fe2+ transport
MLMSAQIRKATLLAASVLLLGAQSRAAEYPIGEPHVLHGMEVAAVYLQPVEMEPPGMMRAAAGSDIHLEADIHANGDNKQGFSEGAWIPYLSIGYELTKVGAETISGELMPMVASDGPHYGDNVKLMGAGTYKLRLIVRPPSGSGHAHFGRHVDRETGVSPWFEPFSVEYEFVFAGTGKKGSY